MNNENKIAGTLIFDGCCEFCKLCVFIVRNKVKGQVECVPYQECLNRFPFLTIEQCKQAVQWVGVDGSVRSGMYAVITCLLYWHDESVKKTGRVLCRWYEKGGLFKKYADWQYRWVGNHRGFMKYMFELILGDTEMMKGHRSSSGKLFFGLRRAIGAKVTFVYTMSLVGVVGYFTYNHFSKKKLLAECILMAIGLLCGLQMVMNPPKFLKYFLLSSVVAVFVLLLMWL